MEHKKKGGKVFGTFCVYVPDELIFAADAIATGLCGGSQFWVPGGEKVLPANTCPLIKASVGARLDKTCPFFRLADIYVGETTCDGKKKAWEILNEDVPVYVMDLPQMKREKDITAWAEEIKLLLKKVEEVTGNQITPEALSDNIKLINRKRDALKRLYNARKNSPVPISGRDALLISQIAFYDDPERFASKTNELCDELEKRVADGKGVFPADAPRIMITGTPMAIPNWKLHHIVETCGAPVVVEETLAIREGKEIEEIAFFKDLCLTDNKGIITLNNRLEADPDVHSITIFLQFFTGTGHKSLTAHRLKWPDKRTPTGRRTVTQTDRNIYILIFHCTDQEYILDADHMAFAF